jgi:hypothetical protein
VLNAGQPLVRQQAGVARPIFPICVDLPLLKKSGLKRKNTIKITKIRFKKSQTTSVLWAGSPDPASGGKPGKTQSSL